MKEERDMKKVSKLTPTASPHLRPWTEGSGSGLAASTKLIDPFGSLNNSHYTELSSLLEEPENASCSLPQPLSQQEWSVCFSRFFVADNKIHSDLV